MADWSLNHNNFNPQTATHSIIFFEENPTKMTLVSHINNKDINNGEILAGINHKNVFKEHHISSGNLDIGQVINKDNSFSGIKHKDHDKSIDTNTVKPSNEDILSIPTKINRERTKSSFKPSLPLRNAIQKEGVSGKQVTVKHSINIIETFVKGNKKKENYDLPSAESTHSRRGSGDNNIRNSFDLDYSEVNYVDRGSQIELVSPSSQILTHMHLIHPTYIPRTTTTSTEKTILNPLFDPRFQPISSNGGKRWTVNKRDNKQDGTKRDKSNDKILEASFFPDLPSSNSKENSGNDSNRPNLYANIGLSVFFVCVSLQLQDFYNLTFITTL